MAPDLFSDPFGERATMMTRKHPGLLGARFQFESNSRELLNLVDSAYADLPRHLLSDAAPLLKVRLLLGPREQSDRGRSEPAPLSMLSGPGYLGGATGS
jgi:hypothetical protein